MVIELGLLVAGLAIYARVTEPRNRRGTWTLITLVVYLVVIQIANVFGPPPPDIASVAIAAQAMWLLVAWGYWIDRNRVPRASSSAG